ncbi:hypothetical protein PTKIN_Ptkin02bG0006200 [Pterospermum kingtungense]
MWTSEEVCAIKQSDRKRVWAEVRYEKVADFCFACRRLSHVMCFCVERETEEVSGDRRRKFGLWMKATLSRNKERRKNLDMDGVHRRCNEQRGEEMRDMCLGKGCVDGLEDSISRHSRFKDCNGEGSFGGRDFRGSQGNNNRGIDVEVEGSFFKDVLEKGFDCVLIGKDEDDEVGNVVDCGGSELYKGHVREYGESSNKGNGQIQVGGRESSGAKRFSGDKENINPNVGRDCEG